MKKSKIEFTIVIPVMLGMVLSCLFYFYFWHEPDSLTLPGAVKITNQPLPASNLSRPGEDADYSKKIKNGKVFLIFLTTGCDACKKEVEIISRNYSKLSSSIQIYGVSIERTDAIENFIEKYNVPFPILIDDKAELFMKLQVKYFPTKFLIEDGIIKETWFGNFPDENKLFQDLQIGGITK